MSSRPRRARSAPVTAGASPDSVGARGGDRETEFLRERAGNLDAPVRESRRSRRRQEQPAQSPASPAARCVSGPGQNDAASRSAAASNTAAPSACSREAAMSGIAATHRPALDLVDSRHGSVVPRVDGETVERVGRKRDDAAVPQNRCGPRDRRSVRCSAGDCDHGHDSSLRLPRLPGRASASGATAPSAGARASARSTRITVSSTNTARRLSVPSSPQMIGLEARPTSDPVDSRPKPAPRACAGMIAPAAV